MKIISIKKGGGFSILGIILVIVAIVVAIGVWALSGQSNTSSSGSGSLTASSLINDSNAIKSMFDHAVITGGVNPSSMKYVPGSADSNNLLNPTNGNLQLNVPKVAIRAEAPEPEGLYVFTTTLAISSIGTALPEIAIVVAGVKDSVCQKINYDLYGSEVIPAAGAFGNGASFVTGATIANPNSVVSIDMNSNTAIEGWMVGCVRADASENNLFFRVLKPN